MPIQCCGNAKEHRMHANGVSFVEVLVATCVVFSVLFLLASSLSLVKHKTAPTVQRNRYSKRDILNISDCLRPYGISVCVAHKPLLASPLSFRMVFVFFFILARYVKASGPCVEPEPSRPGVFDLTTVNLFHFQVLFSGQTLIASFLRTIAFLEQVQCLFLPCLLTDRFMDHRYPCYFWQFGVQQVVPCDRVRNTATGSVFSIKFKLSALFAYLALDTSARLLMIHIHPSSLPGPPGESRRGASTSSAPFVPFHFREKKKRFQPRLAKTAYRQWSSSLENMHSHTHRSFERIVNFYFRCRIVSYFVLITACILIVQRVWRCMVATEQRNQCVISAFLLCFQLKPDNKN